MNNPNPNCANSDCKFQVGIEMTTSVYYPPTYDKHGNNINPDGNVSSGEMTCTTCNKKWKYTRQYGETTFQECNPAISTEGC
nr:MAG: hypothetical protein [Caudoviricetes sp.]